MASNFIIRDPLLDPRLRVVGYHLAWQRNALQASTAAQLETLLGLLAGALNDPEQGWLLGDKVLFLDAVPALLSTDGLHDAALSYKLLRFINSAGLGHGREISSLRQALGLLGHAPLHRCSAGSRCWTGAGFTVRTWRWPKRANSIRTWPQRWRAH